MNASYRNYINYKRARRKFAFKTYLLLFFWLLLAIIQWLTICLVDDARNIFKEYYYVCFITFGLAMLLLITFIFWERLRMIVIVNFIVAFVIVELQIISLFACVARVHWWDLVIFYLICVVLLVAFILIGSILPRSIDLTLDVAVIFILGFIFLICAVFFLMIKFVVPSTATCSYAIAEVFLTILMLSFVMYHTQTINGSRFAEMRLNDALLGSLILFHDFLIIYWLTFYWQFKFMPFEKLIESTTETSTTETSTTTKAYTTEDAEEVEDEGNEDQGNGNEKENEDGNETTAKEEEDETTEMEEDEITENEADETTAADAESDAVDAETSAQTDETSNSADATTATTVSDDAIESTEQQRKETKPTDKSSAESSDVTTDVATAITNSPLEENDEEEADDDVDR